MWVSDKWTDYELIDCSGGEKLERWETIFLFARTLRLYGILQGGTKAGKSPMRTIKQGRGKTTVFPHHGGLAMGSSYSM